MIKEQLQEAIESKGSKNNKAIKYNYFIDEIKLAAEACEAIVDDVAIKFYEWVDTDDYVNEYWRNNRITPVMDGRDREKHIKARKELYMYFKENIYKKNKTINNQNK